MHQVERLGVAGDLTGSPALHLDGYTKSYGREPVVTGVDLRVERGSIHGLLGANGSGKSSMIHGIVGVIAYDSGAVRICGHRAETLEAKRLLGFVPDELPLPDSLSGNEYLDFCARLQPGSDREWRIFLTDLLGLTDALGAFIGDFSHGMKKKLQVIAALAHHPELLILDEPFRGLDADACLSMLALLAAHRDRGGGCLIATHDLGLAEDECDDVSILAAGTLRAQGSPEQLRSTYGAVSLARVFLDVTGLAARRGLAAGLIDEAWPPVARPSAGSLRTVPHLESAS